MPLTRRQIYRRRRIVVFGGLVLVLAALIYSFSTLTASVPATAAELKEPAAISTPQAQPAWPGFGRGAVGAVGFDGVLSASGDQSAAPMASITKIITALVVLDAKPIAVGEDGPSITYTDADVDIYYQEVAADASVAPVRDGLVLSEKQSLTMMLLPSAGNYSISVANWAFGSVDAYLGAAATWLKAHGLANTTVVDTSGLSDESASTPADLVELAKIANTDPTISAIVSQPSAEIPGIGTIENTNKMIGSHNVDGIKTGTNDNAGACLLFSADYTIGSRTVTVVGVLLGGPDMGDHAELDAAVGTLLDSVSAAFHEVTLTKAGERYASYTSEWGDTVTAVAEHDASALVWSNTPITSTATSKTLRTVADGDTVGSVTFTINGTTTVVPLVARGEIEDPGTLWRLGHPGELAA
ncbi:D-alanyl-D-alanine carboxypeptidase [Rathayibacter sp. YIM 133350]|uniref:D-alanyl-D-alanine carboxypeptidase family protein n=1 Tax=Rathayibacter sp. YIM 133350 TaxID=3131992 RepID=UPI00307DDE27